MSAKCNVDVGHPCDAGPDGEPCDGCAEWIAATRAAAWRDWLTMPRDPEKLEQELIDAGRGHLVKPS